MMHGITDRINVLFALSQHGRYVCLKFDGFLKEYLIEDGVCGTSGLWSLQTLHGR